MDGLLKVSIIVPVHNSESFLARCVSSILSQSYKNIECILIENASSDRSKFLCSRYAEENSNVVFESVENAGVSRARNIGLSLATGDIIGFCDADDFLEKDAIRAVVMEFVGTPNVAAVFGGFNLGTTDNTYIYKKYRGLKEQFVSIKKAIQLTLVNDSIMGSVWNKYYRAEFLKGIKFDEELSLLEDMYFNVLVLSSIQDNFKIKILNTALYCYMENLDSVTHDKNALFDENNESKYISALKKIGCVSALDPKLHSCVKMKICCCAIGGLIESKPDKAKREKLILELKKTYINLLENLFVNNWIWNIKRAVYGLGILLMDRK